MPQVLYSLRWELDKDNIQRYRITKFVDGEVESSYYTSREHCECPAGVRPSCRHRQMLPHMLNAQIINTHWFMLWPEATVVDFEGTTRAAYERALDQQSLGDALRSANIPGVTVVDLGDPTILHNTIAEALGEPTQPAKPWRRL